MTETEIIDYILEDFDFKKVHKAMKALNWKWGGEHPEIEDLKNQAKDLLINCAKTKSDQVSCGGFVVTRLVYKKEVSYELSFVVTSSEYCP